MPVGPLGELDRQINSMTHATDFELTAGDYDIILIIIDYFPRNYCYYYYTLIIPTLRNCSICEIPCEHYWSCWNKN